MEKNRRDTVIHSEGGNEMNEDEAATSSPLNEQIDTEDESEQSPMERAKEVMENIGFTINNI